MQIICFGDVMKKIISFLLTVMLVFTCFASCKETDIVYYDYENLSDYISLADYKGLEFPLTTSVIIDEIEEKYHSDMTDHNLSIEKEMPKGTKVKNGDIVIIDYVGKHKGKAFEGGTAKGQSLEIGSDSYIDGFEDGLIGVTLGETVNLNLTFPDSYPKNPSLEGEKVVFTVTVNKITSHVYPTLESVGETMAVEMGFEDLDAYRESVLITVKTDYLWAQKVLANSEVIKYPEKELNINKKHYEERYQNLVSDYGQESVNTAIKTSAENLTKEELVGYAIAQKEGIKVKKEDIVKEAKELYGDGYTKEDYQKTRKQLLMKKVVQFVLDSAKVK